MAIALNRIAAAIETANEMQQRRDAQTAEVMAFVKPAVASALKSMNPFPPPDDDTPAPPPVRPRFPH